MVTWIADEASDLGARVQIPSGPFRFPVFGEGMDARVLPFFLLLLPAPACALFLAGSAHEGGEVSILCEGQRTAYVSLPGGQALALLLDSSSQASFQPQQSGPYTVQCGNETKTLFVRLPQQPEAAAPAGESMLLPVAAIALIVAAAAAAAWLLLGCRTEFTKRQEGGRVLLRIRAGQELSMVKVADPDGGGPELLIPHLAKGEEWQWDYERADGAPLAPATMRAKCNGREISLISGAPVAGAAQQQKEKRHLPRAQG